MNSYVWYSLCIRLHVIFFLLAKLLISFERPISLWRKNSIRMFKCLLLPKNLDWLTIAIFFLFEPIRRLVSHTILITLLLCCLECTVRLFYFKIICRFQKFGIYMLCMYHQNGHVSTAFKRTCNTCHVHLKMPYGWYMGHFFRLRTESKGCNILKYEGLCLPWCVLYAFLTPKNSITAFNDDNWPQPEPYLFQKHIRLAHVFLSSKTKNTSYL